MQPKRDGQECNLKNHATANKVALKIQSSKTDIYNRSGSWSHSRFEEYACRVKAAVSPFYHFPKRHGGGADADKLFSERRDPGLDCTVSKRPWPSRRKLDNNGICNVDSVSKEEQMGAGLLKGKWKPQRQGVAWAFHAWCRVFPTP